MKCLVASNAKGEFLDRCAHASLHLLAVRRNSLSDFGEMKIYMCIYKCTFNEFWNICWSASLFTAPPPRRGASGESKNVDVYQCEWQPFYWCRRGIVGSAAQSLLQVLSHLELFMRFSLSAPV